MFFIYRRRRLAGPVWPHSQAVNLLTHIGIENTITEVAFLLHQKINGSRATMRL